MANDDLDSIKHHLGNLEKLINALEAQLRGRLAARTAAVAVPAVWRLTLECGHYRLDGPRGPSEPQRYMIGDMTFCEICPRRDTPAGPTMLVRQVVNIEHVLASQYREPKPEADAERREGLR